MSISEVEIKKEGFENCSEHSFELGKFRTPTWVKRLHTNICSCYSIQALRSRHQDGTSLLFLGVEPDVTIGKQTFEYLYAFVTNYDYSGIEVTDRYDWRMGFVSAVAERLWQMTTERSNNADVTALVLCKKQIAHDFMTARYSEIRTEATKSRKVGLSYYDGYKVGKDLPLNRPLDTLDDGGRLQ
jgi:hypothetical protein